MFYQTTLQSVGDNCAVDVFGRSLKFIGYLPVQPGDIVWTDGNVIFGNVPPRSTAIDGIIGGVPVLGDNNLRGYVTKNGKFRYFRIYDKDNNIINDNKYFRHGDGIFLDVEIGRNNEGAPVVFNVFQEDADIAKICIHKNGEQIKEVDFEHNDDLNISKKHAEQLESNFIGSGTERFRRYEEAYNPKILLQVLGSRVDEQGNWHAVVAQYYYKIVDVYSHVQGVHYPGFSTTRSESKTEYVVDGQVISRDELLEKYFYPLGTVEKINFLANFKCVRITDITWYEANNHYVIDKWTAYDWSVRYKRERFCHFFVFDLLHFKNGQLEKTIDHKYLRTSAYAWDEISYLSTSSNNDYFHLSQPVGPIGYRKRVYLCSLQEAPLPTSKDLIEEEEDIAEYYNVTEYIPFEDNGFLDTSLIDNTFSTFRFPLQDGYSADMTIWQVKAVYDNRGNKICGELPIQNEKAFFCDYRVVDNNVDNNIKILIYADGTSKKTYSTNDIGFFFYDENNQKRYYTMPNVSITKLSNSRYLIGFNGGNLYLVKNGVPQRVTDNDNDKLKNFRLRELRNIAKARK